MTATRQTVLASAFPVGQSTNTGKWGWRRVNGCLNLKACRFASEAEATADRDAVLIDPAKWDDAITAACSFGGILSVLRKAASMTYADLGDAAGLSRQRVHQLEAGTHRPRWDEVQALATALGVSTDTFRDPA